MRRLVASAALERPDVVLEVGGGTGALTELLAARVRQVVCVEIDPGLLAILADRFGECSNVRLVGGDVLAGKHQLCPTVSDAVRAAGGPVRLVSNLPYQVATPLLMNLLVDYPEVDRLVFTVQAEVAERIVARPGSRAFGPLGILTGLVCTVATVARLPPEVFWPAPAVHSVMLRLDAGPSPFSDRSELRAFTRFVRATFDHRRKTLRSALGYLLDDDAVEQAGKAADLSRRPEEAGPATWVEMFRTVRGALAAGPS
jgi:16S rRNA (adenine1518-N6/adenine1519-N6)-dimethyltransferase